MRQFSPEIQKTGAYTDMLILCSSQVHERASCCVPSSPVLETYGKTVHNIRDYVML
jgi:hypothetical protein